MQNMSVKVILNKLHRDHSTEVTLELHWLKVEYRILYKTLKHSSQMPIWNGTRLLEEKVQLYTV